MKKGFTLIELLAVILILGIIATIAIYQINKLTGIANEESIKESASNIIKVADNYYADLGYVNFPNEGIDIKDLDIKSTGFRSGYVQIIDGEYTVVNLTDGKYCVNGTKENLSIVKGSCKKLTIVPKISTDTHKGIVYLDPSDLSKTCNASNSSIGTGKTGCLKFYIYNDEGNNYKLILDHNTTPTIQWVSQADYVAAGGTASEYGTTGNNSKGPITVTKKLKEDTKGWFGNPRLITANEVAHIVGADLSTTLQWDSSKPSGTTIGTQISWFHFDGSGNTYTGWQTQVTDATHISKYAWLYDYTANCREYGCNVETTGTSGYWVLADSYNSTFYVWGVSRRNRLVNNDYVSSSILGIRPVISISKKLFS